MGIARAGMGVDAADYDRSGHPAHHHNFAQSDGFSLYHNEGNGLLWTKPRSPKSAAPRVSLDSLFSFLITITMAAGYFCCRGHIEDQIERVPKRVSYASLRIFSETSALASSRKSRPDGAIFCRSKSGAGRGLCRIDTTAI